MIVIMLKMNLIYHCYNWNEVPCNKERQTSNPKLGRILKWSLEIDEDILSTLEGKRSLRMVRLWASGLCEYFFVNNTLVEKCQLFVQLLRMQKLRPVLSKLIICVNKKIGINVIIVKNIFSALNSIGKRSRDKGKTIARRVITTSLVSHNLRKARFLRQTCVDLNISRMTFNRAL